MEPKIVLASASPRRHRLLREAGVSFEVDPADVDETMDTVLSAGAIAEDLAVRKARAVAARRPDGAARIVLGADTVVVLGEDGSSERRFLEKAADESEALEMLGALSGTRHRVITGVAVLGGAPGGPRVGHETTFVTMGAIARDRLQAYVAGGEWRGKAGAYAIQGKADEFVSGLEGGSFDNVVGLPVALTLGLLRGAGWGPGS